MRDNSRARAETEPDLDFGLIAPLAIPATSKIPDPVTGMSTCAEYEHYFRITRGRSDLIEWSKAWMRMHDQLLADLDQTSLDTDDKYKVLKGLALAGRVTVDRWVRLADETRRHGPARSGNGIGGV